MPEASEITPRSVCAHCSRPSVVCLCGALRPVVTRTRVVILQHPRESDVPINTARLAELQLSNAERHVAVKLDEVPRIRERLSDVNAPAILLYPGDEAQDLAAQPPEGAVTLLVLDGTWWQAKKLLSQNPELRQLPRYSLRPRAPSRYRIRKEPALHCISTIEAIGEALSVLEGPSFDFEALLAPFEEMVEHQLRFARTRGARRHLAPRQNAAKPRLPGVLAQREGDLIVGYGEANAWPKGSELGREPEVVHWAAERLASGERFEAWIAPRRSLAESFSYHAQIAPELVLAGESFASFCARWRAFLRPSDLLLGWGCFASERLRAEGAVLPELFDLRLAARRQLRRRTGDVQECAALLDATLPAPWAMGRTGVRLAGALAVARALLLHAR